MVAAAVGVGLAAILGQQFARRANARGDQPPPAAASFVGSGTCVSCHSNESAEWRRSQHRAAMAPANEFIAMERFNADRAEERVNLGTFLAERGDSAAAERELRAAIGKGPASIPAYVNLADVYRAQGRDVDGERLLREGLAGSPASGTLHFALGLVLTRMHQSDSALHEFARAAGLEPGTRASRTSTPSRCTRAERSTRRSRSYGRRCPLIAAMSKSSRRLRSTMVNAARARRRSTTPSCCAL